MEIETVERWESGRRLASRGLTSDGRLACQENSLLVARFSLLTIAPTEAAIARLGDWGRRDT
ncbi:hypothetical protein OOK60_17655 [Trichothermofontia sichuanensis B231]|uniref:hypothetical protein n=1 Tax=Trichothermofontia sichuanensis TaxID=3045816 RepID=UPI0022465040|nr:hypothetical protein [Trichothermofontia sichuanensis]UZQ54278.1 hypothetical protein OOK60_17655 [Trichothermofontia sichuanensis B231]